MHCKQIARQTRGQIQEVELDGLSCSRAGMCRRKGICALSPFARPEIVPRDEQNAPAAVSHPDADHMYPTAYEILEFKYSLGFHWVRKQNFEESVRTIDNLPHEEQPRIIRRVEYFRLPD